jgi:hypothetical protein
MSHRSTVVVRTIVVLLLVVTLLSVGTRASVQRSPRFSVMGRFTTGTAAAVPIGLPIRPSDAFVYQGYLTDAVGTPLTGMYTITFRLYRATSILTFPFGTSYTLVDTKVVVSIQVTNGLFTASISGFGSYFTGEYQLYLGIQVESDPEMTPYQAIANAPTALGLHPGTIITNMTSDEPGLEVHSVADGIPGAAIIAQSDRSAGDGGGIGLYAEAQGADDTIVAANGGTGPLFKGFGGNGGEDEIRINNDGSIETMADSYIWVPGNTLVKNLSTDTTRWDIQTNGAARIWSGVTLGLKTVYFPITLPTVLYGRSVTVESITVYYRTMDGTKGYITGTYLHKLTDADTSVSLISDTVDHVAESAVSYTLSPTSGNTLASYQGLGLFLYLLFADNTNWVQIGGIRIRLGHSSQG